MVRRRRLLVLTVVVALIAVGGVLAVRAVLHGGAAAPPICYVGDPRTGYVLDPEQAANAATVAAVGKREGLPDHAVTVALAAALQETKLRNLAYGDRDSLGIFQQRPSQGWGSPAQLVRPAFAAQAFYRHLQQVQGWQQLPVAEAAQAVQHSADGSAYGGWEEQARAIARALTGEEPGGLTCEFAEPTPPQSARLAAAASLELGAGALARSGTQAEDWRVAEWLVAHSVRFGIVAVSLRGMKWTHDVARWRVDAKAAGARPSYLLAPATKK